MPEGVQVGTKRFNFTAPYNIYLGQKCPEFCVGVYILGVFFQGVLLCPREYMSQGVSVLRGRGLGGGG